MIKNLVLFCGLSFIMSGCSLVVQPDINALLNDAGPSDDAQLATGDAAPGTDAGFPEVDSGILDQPDAAELADAGTDQPDAYIAPPDAYVAPPDAYTPDVGPDARGGNCITVAGGPHHLNVTHYVCDQPGFTPRFLVVNSWWTSAEQCVFISSFDYTCGAADYITGGVPFPDNWTLSGSVWTSDPTSPDCNGAFTCFMNIDLATGRHWYNCNVNDRTVVGGRLHTCTIDFE